MATNPRTATITLEEYLAAEEVAEERSEFVDGTVVAMVGGSFRHNAIIHNLHLALGTVLRGSGCGMVSQGMKLKIARHQNVLYPDVAVYCGAPEIESRGGEVLLNPTLLIEVLSPSSEGYDRGKKWERYRSIASLQEYLLIAQDEPLVENYKRHGENFWLYGETAGLESEIRLESLNVTLKLADIYDGVLSADSGREE
jgi:Uma2 family endonuclease